MCFITVDEYFHIIFHCPLFYGAELRVQNGNSNSKIIKIIRFLYKNEKKHESERERRIMEEKEKEKTN